MLGEGVCRICGCSDQNACVTEAGPCWWLDELEMNLCSACEHKLSIEYLSGGKEV